MSGPANNSLAGVEGLNSTVSNSTSADMSALQTLQQLDFLLLEFKLVGSALGIIYLGAHASLRRPPSAAPPKSKKSGKGSKEDEEEDEEEPNLSQGLELTDAIMFPLLAGFMLVGLYYLIQWLKDPAILSKILRYYMSFVSIASMVTMYAHGMDLFSSFAFPRYWRGWDGKIRKTDQGKQIVTLCDDVGNSTDGDKPNPASTSPLPGVLAMLTPTKSLKALSWKIRNILTRRWIFRLFVHGMGEEKANVKFATMLSIPLAAATAIVYFTTNTPFLSNLLGYGMCYCSLLILSPTDLLIGTLVLVGLFFYDIIMVFYT